MEVVENGTGAEGLYGGGWVHNGEVLYQEGVEFGHVTKLGREGVNLKQDDKSINGNTKYQILHCIIHAIELLWLVLMYIHNYNTCTCMYSTVVKQPKVYM